MEWWIACLVLAFTFIENALGALYTLQVVEKKPLLSAIIGSKIDVLGAISVIAYTENYLYLIPLWAGSFLGTLSSVHVYRLFKNRERLKNLDKARLAKLSKSRQNVKAVINRTTEK